MHPVTTILRTFLLLALLLQGGLALSSPTRQDIQLPPPDTTGGIPLMQALQKRQSTRDYQNTPIPIHVLSSLLWAAQGVNRDNPDFRTAPSFRNINGIEIYVVLPYGTYLYQPTTHSLKQILQEDIRFATGTQEFVNTVPLNLVYVADLSKQPSELAPTTKLTVSCADIGFIGENVYLFCASAGLGTVFRAMLDPDYLTRRLGLPAFKKVIYAQSIGYPEQPETALP